MENNIVVAFIDEQQEEFIYLVVAFGNKNFDSDCSELSTFTDKV